MEKTKKVDFNPLVSIIIPVYNGSNYVREAIDSALAQTYKNIEIIVVNDGSTDNTEEIVKSYGKKIRYFKKENGGVSTALNLGIRKMKGEYFSWLSHDDLYYPDKIENQINILKDKGPDVIVYGNYVNIDNNSSVLEKIFLDKKNDISKLNFGVYALLNGLVHGCTLIFKKDYFYRFGFFNIKYKTIQDYDLWFDIFREVPVIFTNHFLVKSRQHPDQCHITLSKIAEEEQSILWDKMINDLNIKEIAQLTGRDIVYFNLDKNQYSRPIRFLNKDCLKKILDLNYEKRFTVVDLYRIFLSLPQMQKRSLFSQLRELVSIPDRFCYLYLYIRLFFFSKNGLKKTVLIFEPNKYHGETFASYIKYFNDLGYKVHFILDKIHREEDPFCYLGKDLDVKFFFTNLSFYSLKKLISSSFLRKYFLIFATSNLTYHNNEVINITNSFNKRNKNKIFVVEHDLLNITIENEFGSLKEDRLFTLWPRSINEKTTLMVNPHYYGDFIKKNDVSLKKIVNFLVIGTLNKNYKNFSLLEDAVLKLSNNGINKFKINIVGDNSPVSSVPGNIKKHFNFLGRLKFKEMFNLISKSDFLILLLDSEQKEHFRYKNRLTPGAVNLSLGFQKPLLLSDAYASIYGFSNKNAVVYHKNDLYNGLLNSVNMSKKAKIILESNLFSYSKSLYKKSLENLSYAIKKNTNSIHLR